MLTVWCGRISEPAGAECHVRYDLTASHTAKLRERGGVGQLIACHLWLINIVHCDLRMGRNNRQSHMQMNTNQWRAWPSATVYSAISNPGTHTHARARWLHSAGLTEYGTSGPYRSLYE